MLAEEQFTYRDLVEITGLKIGYLRKVRAEVGARFPDLLHEVGKEEVLAGRRPILWTVNPEHRATLQRLAAAEAKPGEARVIEDLPLLHHATELLDSAAEQDRLELRDLFDYARDLLGQTHKVLDQLRSSGKAVVSDGLAARLSETDRRVESLERHLNGAVDGEASEILTIVAELGGRRSRRSGQLDQIVASVCSAMPGAGRSNLKHFATAMISASNDSSQSENLRRISDSWRDNTFADNVVEAVSGSLRHAARVPRFQEVASRLLNSLHAIGPEADTDLAGALGRAAEVPGLAEPLRSQARSAAIIWHPRGELDGTGAARPFSMSDEDSARALALAQ